MHKFKILFLLPFVTLDRIVGTFLDSLHLMTAVYPVEGRVIWAWFRHVSHVFVHKFKILFLLPFVTLDRIVWTLLDSLHLMTAVCPVEGRVIWAWFRHVSRVFVHKFKILFLLPFVTLDRIFWTFLDSLHLMTAVYPVEGCVIWAWFRHVSHVFVHKFKILFLLPFVTLDRIVWTLLDSLHLMTAVCPVKGRVIWAWFRHVSRVFVHKFKILFLLPFVTLDRIVWTFLDSLHLMTAVYPVEGRVIWAWFRHVSRVFVHKFKILFLLPFVTMDRIVWTLLDSLHLMTAVCPVEGRVIWAWFRYVNRVFVHKFKILFLLPFVTLDRIVWTLLDSLHLMTAVCPVKGRVILAWFRHVSRVFVHKFKILFLLPFVTLDRIVWTLLDSLHLMTAVYPVEGRVIWAWFRHVSCVFVHKFKILFLLPFVTLDRIVWTLLDSLHLMTAVYPVEGCVIWAWFRHVSHVFVHKFKILFLLPFVTLDRIVWTLLDSLHLMTAVYPVEGRVIWAWFRHVSCVFVHKFKILFLLPFVTMDRIVWTLLDSLHLMTAVCPVEGRVIWAWFRYVNRVFVHKFKILFLLPFVTLDRIVWTLLDSLHLMTAVCPVKGRVILAWFRHVSRVFVHKFKILFLLPFVTLDRIVWTFLDSLHLMTAVYPVEGRVIWAWFRHVSCVFVHKFKILFLLPFVTLDRIVWTLLDSLHLMTAVYPVEGRVIWAWFRHVSRVFVHKFKIPFLLPFVTLDRIVWTLLDSLHLMTAVYPVEGCVIWAWFRHVSHVFVHKFKILFLLPFVTLDRIVWTLLDSLHLMTAVYPVEGRVIWAWFRHVSCVFVHKFKILFLLPLVTLDRIVWTLLDSLHLMTSVYPVEGRVIWAWFCHVSRVFVHKFKILFLLPFVTLDRIVWTLLDSLHLMTAVYPVEGRVIWAWFRHVSCVLVHKFKILFLLPFVTLDRIVWTLLDSLHLMTAVYPVEGRVIWAWFCHVSRVFVHKFKILFLLPFVTLDRIVWTFLDSLHLMTAVYPVEGRVIWAWFRHVSCVFVHKFKILFLLPFLTLDRIVWTLLDSLHLMTAVCPVEGRVIWA